jgi:predicted DNA-binding transcriptional regulator AlpA
MNDTQLLTEREAADIARLSTRTLKRLAETGDGPARIRLTARRIAYRRADLIRWIETRTAANGRHAKQNTNA